MDINLSEVHLLDSTGFLASPVDLIDHPSYSLPLQANRTRSLISSTRNMKAAYLSDRFILQDLTVPLHKTSNTRYLTIFYILIYIHQDAMLHSLFYLETALHVSGGTTTHHQERIQLYLQHLVFVRPLLLPAAIAAGSSNGLKNTRCCRYSCMRS